MFQNSSALPRIQVFVREDGRRQKVYITPMYSSEPPRNGVDEVPNRKGTERVSKQLVNVLGNYCLLYGAEFVTHVHSDGKKQIADGEYCFGIRASQVQCANIFLRMAQSQCAEEWEKVVQTISSAGRGKRMLFYFPGFKIY